MKRVSRVNPGSVLIAASVVALAIVACVKEGDDAPPLPGVLGAVQMTAAGGSGGNGMAGSTAMGGSAGQGGSGGQGGSAGSGQGGTGQAGSATLLDAGADADAG